MSVSTGTCARLVIDARIRSPSARPGPRHDRPDVRFALSYDALKMNGTCTRPAIAARRLAISSAWLALSMTHGPPMKTNGWPAPMEMSPIWTGGTVDIIEVGWLRQVG